PLPDAASYAAVVSAFSAAAAASRRRQLLHRAEELLLRSRNVMLEVHGSTYCSLLQSSARLGDAECVGRLWRQLIHLNFQPNLSTRLEVMQVASSAPFLGMAQLACQAVEAPREEALFLAARPLVELGDWRGVERLLRHKETSIAAALLQLQALSEAVPRNRQKAMQAASALLSAGGRLTRTQDTEKALGAVLLRRALGGREVHERRPEASAGVTLQGPLQQRRAAFLCASRVGAALDGNDAERATGWIHRWSILTEACPELRPQRSRLPRLWRRFRLRKRG
ncbi:unnamed protein product, partial [Effrenium voratum]